LRPVVVSELYFVFLTYATNLLQSDSAGKLPISVLTGFSAFGDNAGIFCLINSASWTEKRTKVIKIASAKF